MQLLFSPEGGGRREALGRLLKADLLVLLRAAEQKGKNCNLDVLVWETKARLRLFVERIGVSDNAFTGGGQATPAAGIGYPAI